MGVVCLIGARKGSKRLPHKNKQEICGRKLYSIAVDAAVYSGIFSKIIVTTDDEDIIGGLSNFPEVMVDRRKEEFAGSQVVIWEVGVYILEKYSSDFEQTKDLCFITPCHPFRNSKHIREAYELYKSSGADSLVSVTEFPAPIELAVKLDNGKVKRNWPGPVRKGNYEKSFFPNGAITFVKKEFLTRNIDVYSVNTIGYEMGWPYCLDIDHQQDLDLARTLANEFLKSR